LHFKNVRLGHAAAPGEHVHAQGGQTLAHGLARGRDVAVFSGLQRGEVHADLARGHADLGLGGQLLDGAGCPKPELGGNAAAVQAGAAHVGGLHQRGSEAGGGGVHGGVEAAGTAAQHEQIVCRGHALPSRGRR
jgi:hypothetical protein